MLFDFLGASWLVKGTAVVAAIALLLGARPKLMPICLIAAAAGVVFAGVFGHLFSTLGFDYRIFWEAGRAVWAGQDPYAADLPLLNPPSALPLFALFALAPFEISFLFWTVVNVLACLALLPFCQSVLLAQERESTEESRQSAQQLAARSASEGSSGTHLMSAPSASGARAARDDAGLPQPSPSLALRAAILVLIGLIPALFLSGASFDSFILGQMSLFEAVVLLAALHCQAGGRPILAGFWLALASVKVATMLPFLLLFHRQRDLWTWVALPVAVLGLCLMTGRPSELPGRLTAIRERIKELESPGKVNDYSFEGTRSENMLGFDHAFYRLGLRDRGVIRIAQYLALAVLGGWVAYQVLGKQRLPRGAACSLVALFSVVFLYHRNYDTVILALPFVYCAGQARSASDNRRWLFICCAVAILLVWYRDAGGFLALQRHSLEWGGWGRLVQAIVLPYATWLILAAMICLVVATRGGEVRPTP